MNVIVSNKQKNIIDNANIDTIKDLNGLFNIDDLINKLKNYIFNKIIIDATSLINFTSDEVLQKLVNSIGSDRLIILLPSVPEPPKEFVDKLINFKIYNFSNNINDVVDLVNNPRNQNSFSPDLVENVGNGFYIDNSVKNDAPNDQMDFSLPNIIESMNISDGSINNDNNFQSEIPNDINVLNNSNDNTSNIFSDINNSHIDLDDGFKINDVSEDGAFPDFNFESSNNLEDNNVFLHPNLNLSTSEEKKTNKMVIGFKNITIHAGSTSLIYMLLRVIDSIYHKKTLAIEIDNNNFKYYQNRNMMSVNSADVINTIENSDADIIFIDLNNYDNLSICNDVLYLVEPSIIRLNRLMMEDNGIFKKLSGKKVILNMSFLNNEEVSAFSNEAGMPMFYNIPPLNDRVQNSILEELLDKLGIK